MAVDDVISDYETSVANGARMSIQPASGDEWLLTNLLSEYAPYHLNPHTNTAEFNTGAMGGNTGSGDDFGAFGGIRGTRFLVTNSEYLRLENTSGATSIMGFSGIKTKE